MLIGDSALSPAAETDSLEQILASLLVRACSLPFGEMEYRKAAADRPACDGAAACGTVTSQVCLC